MRSIWAHMSRSAPRAAFESAQFFIDPGAMAAGHGLGRLHAITSGRHRRRGAGAGLKRVVDTWAPIDNRSTVWNRAMATCQGRP